MGERPQYPMHMRNSLMTRLDPIVLSAVGNDEVSKTVSLCRKRVTDTFGTARRLRYESGAKSSGRTQLIKTLLRSRATAQGFPTAIVRVACAM